MATETSANRGPSVPHAQKGNIVHRAPSFFSVAVVALAAMVPAACRERAFHERLSDGEKVYGLSLVWREAAYNFAYFDRVPGVDWDDAYREYIPRAVAATSTFEYYRVLQRFSALLRDGHTEVYLPDGLAADYVGFPDVQARAVGESAVVSNVPASLADAVPLGSEILAVDGTATRERLVAAVFPYIPAPREEILWRLGVRGSTRQGYGLLAGPIGSRVRLDYRTPSGQRRSIRLPRTRGSTSRRVDWVRPDAQTIPSLEFKRLEEGIAYVALNSFGDQSVRESFVRTLPDLESAPGVIVDIRRNRGGDGSIAVEVASHFTRAPLEGAAWRTRKHVAAYKAWGQVPSVSRRMGWELSPDTEQELEQYAKYAAMNAWICGRADTVAPAETGLVTAPTMLLIGPDTGSAAEDLAVMLDGAPTVMTVGAPTFGSTGQQVWVFLPGGGSAHICAKRDTFADGREFVGPGVRPDVAVATTVADVQSGRDPVLEAAVSMLAK